MSADIADLIAKLEVATGPDRMLDEAIAIAAFPDLAVMPRTDIGGWVHPSYGRIAPPSYYTSSIDAALTLVPEGAVWHVMTDYGGLNRAKIGPPGNPRASVYVDADRPTFVQEDGATPALALCIAALKAHANQHPLSPATTRTESATSANSQSGGNFMGGEAP